MLEGPGDRQNAGDPELGALGDNGGPTPTMMPLVGSPLLDTVPLDVCETLDWDVHRPRVVVIEYLTHGRPSQDEAIRLHFGRLPYRLIHRTTSNLIFAETRLPRVLGRRAAVRRYFARRDGKRFPLDAGERLFQEGAP